MDHAPSMGGPNVLAIRQMVYGVKYASGGPQGDWMRSPAGPLERMRTRSA